MCNVFSFSSFQSNEVQQDEQTLIAVRQDRDTREERRISLAQVAQFNQSAMFQLFGVPPISLQNGGAMNLSTKDLVHILSSLCLKTPAAWYSLVTFILKSGVDLITLAALDHSTLLSEAASLDVLMELFYSTGVLSLSGKACYCASHLLTLGTRSIFGSGNILLVVNDVCEAIENTVASSSVLQNVRLVVFQATRRRIAKLALPPFHVEANLQLDMTIGSLFTLKQFKEFGIITRVTPSAISITTSSYVYTNVSWDLLPYNSVSNNCTDFSSILLQGVLLTIKIIEQQDSSDIQRSIIHLRFYPTYLSEFAEVLSIEPCIPSTGSSIHTKKLDDQSLFVYQSPIFTAHTNSTKIDKIDKGEPPKALKDIFWAAVSLRVTVARHSFVILAISRLSRLLYEVLLQIGQPLYCLWTVSNLSAMNLHGSNDDSSQWSLCDIRASSVFRTNFLIVDIQLPIRFYGKVNMNTPNSLLELTTNGREHQLFNLSVLQYKSLIGFITRTAPIALHLDAIGIGTVWFDITASLFCPTNDQKCDDSSCAVDDTTGPSLFYSRPFSGIYSHPSHSLSTVCQSCSSTEEHEELLRTEKVSCSLCGGLTNWAAVVCAHVIHFTAPIPFEITWRANMPLVFLSNNTYLNEGSELVCCSAIRERIIKAMLARGINKSNSSSPCVFVHTNTLMCAVLQYVSFPEQAGSSHSMNSNRFPIFEEGDSILGQCTCAELFFNGESICLTEIEVTSLHSGGTGSISLNTGSVPLVHSEQLSTKTILPTIGSVSDVYVDAADSIANPFLVSDGINLSTPRYYSEQDPEGVFDSTILDELPTTFSPPGLVQQRCSSIPQAGAFIEQDRPNLYQLVDSSVPFPLTNSNSNSMLLFPPVDTTAHATSNIFINSSTASTPKRTFFPVITNITDMSELSSDIYTHSYLNMQTASDTTRTNCLSYYDENRSTTGSLHESVDLLSTLDCSRHLFFSQDIATGTPEGMRSVIGYVRYHFPNFNLAVISFEDPLRTDGWVHSLAVWNIPTSIRNSRVCYRKCQIIQSKHGKGLQDNTPEYKRPFFARARVHCTVAPFNGTSTVYIALNVQFLDYHNPCDGLLVTKDVGGKIKKGKKLAGDGTAATKKVIHASVYWQESTKGAESHTSFGFVRLCNGYERHFSINTAMNYLGHLVTITLTSHNKTHRNTCELHGSLLKPPIQQHWLIGRLVLLLRGKECEQVGQHVLDLMNGSFRTKITSAIFDTPGKLSKMILVMGFILTESHQNTHVDCSFFRLVLPKLVSDRLEVGMLLRFTLKEGAYHKVMDISDSLYSSPCSFLNYILETDGIKHDDQYEVSTLPDGVHVYVTDQPVSTEVLEGNSRRLSCWAIDNISFINDIFKGSYRNIESRKCRGIEPDESFFARYGRYLSSSRSTLIYLPRPALEVQPSLFFQSEVYFYMVHFVYNEQKPGVSAEANTLTKNIIKGKVYGPKTGRIYPIKLSGMGHNNVIYLFISDSTDAASTPPVDGFASLLKCIVSSEKFSTKPSDGVGTCIVPLIALFVLHSRLLAYAQQVLKMEDFASTQKWARSIMHGITTGLIPVVASDFYLSLKFTKELFINGPESLQAELAENQILSDSYSTLAALTKKLANPCFWCYIVQTISVRNPPVHVMEFPGMHPSTSVEIRSTYPCDSLEF